uniref:Uncharacterized protein n=1 Tax=Haptolina ericina TaxID=156174 RepID=A0A7S3B2D4_9EUKA
MVKEQASRAAREEQELRDKLVREREVALQTAKQEEEELAARRKKLMMDSYKEEVELSELLELNKRRKLELEQQEAAKNTAAGKQAEALLEAERIVNLKEATPTQIRAAAQVLSQGGQPVASAAVPATGTAAAPLTNPMPGAQGEDTAMLSWLARHGLSTSVHLPLLQLLGVDHPSAVAPLRMLSFADFTAELKAGGATAPTAARAALYQAFHAKDEL